MSQLQIQEACLPVSERAEQQRHMADEPRESEELVSECFWGR